MEHETTYEGSCHCGAVTFTASMPPVTSAMSCNCSHCSRKGLLLTFIPREKFVVTGGKKQLTEYRFNKKQIEHLFCRTCGVQAFGYGTGHDGTAMAAVNVRCLPAVDLDTLSIEKVNGRDF